MNPELLMRRGQLATAEKDAKALAIKIQGLKKEMRIYLAQHAQPEELEAERVQQLSGELVQAHQQYEAALTQMASLREELGLPRYEAR